MVYYRVRYEQHKGSIYRSVQTFKSKNGGSYRVYIDLDKMTYKIKNVTKNIILRSTEKDGKKAPKMKKTLLHQVKQALQSVGVKFDIEIRGL